MGKWWWLCRGKAEREKERVGEREREGERERDRERERVCETETGRRDGRQKEEERLGH